MRQTSLLAFHSLTGVQINKRQREVLDGLKEIEPATNRQVAEHTGIPINVVTPRMGELVKKDRAEAAFVGIDRGRKATFWQTKEEA